MKRATALIRASSLVGFEDMVKHYDKDPERLMALAGLSTTYLREPDLYFPLQRYIKLLEIGAEETSNPLFGAELGFQQSIKAFGTFSYAIASSATVGTALDTILDSYRMHTTGILLVIEHFNNKVILSASIIVPTPLGSQQMMGHLAATGTEILRTFLGKQWHADEIHFAHKVAYHDRKRYRQLFGENLIFNAEKTALIFDADILNAPLPSADAHLHELIKRQVYSENILAPDDLILQVEANIRRGMPHGDIGLESIAKSVAMSQRSLQRNLSDQGTSFQELLDAIRKQTAEHYLVNSSLQLTQIAILLGFKTQANLSHAFRRWNGVSPREWRKTHR
ncbi:AraC family transcriptional regulator [Parahaliea mediterranea]|uniref:AraC family transcriptional regulator n=1 Tax=Parahaliea mediterranea TaxID=651086 RepID=UPI0014741778|nr:AraC family transcriptional regulator [Parahaliea mediterranea]